MAHINEPEISRTKETTGTIYKVIYTQTDYRTLILMDVSMGIMFLLSVFLVLYIGKKILKPFHGMMSLTEELAKGNLYDTPEKRAQVYAGIDKNVTEMEGYVTEIMAASREDFLNLTVEMGEVYLSSVMEYINAYYTDKLSNLHTVFEVKSYLDCLLSGDRDGLIEVVQNIMENALKYGDGKCITISFSTEEETAIMRWSWQERLLLWQRYCFLHSDAQSSLKNYHLSMRYAPDRQGNVITENHRFVWEKAVAAQADF